VIEGTLNIPKTMVFSRYRQEKVDMLLKKILDIRTFVGGSLIVPTMKAEMALNDIEKAAEILIQELTKD
jgi:hypothetical protein